MINFVSKPKCFSGVYNWIIWWFHTFHVALHRLTSQSKLTPNWSPKKTIKRRSWKGVDSMRKLLTNEPQYDKTNKMSVCPAKTQISMGIRPVWSESSLSAWRKLGSLATHQAHSEDSDQTGRMPRLIWVFPRPTAILLVLSRHGSYEQVKRPGSTIITDYNQLLYWEEDQTLNGRAHVKTTRKQTRDVFNIVSSRRTHNVLVPICIRYV